MNSKSLRAYILTGLVVWLPILATFVVLRFIIDILDSTIALLPNAYQPQQLFGRNIPGLGVILSLALLIVTGIFARNFFGQHVVRWGETLLAKIPLVRSIYTASKQIIQTLFESNSQAFRKVLLVEYPRKGMWSIAFLTGTASSQVSNHTHAETLSLFIPTTPNPTSGFLILVPKNEAIELDMSIEEALKFVISLGVMQPALSSEPNSPIHTKAVS